MVPDHPALLGSARGGEGQEFQSTTGFITDLIIIMCHEMKKITNAYYNCPVTSGTDTNTQMVRMGLLSLDSGTVHEGPRKLPDLLPESVGNIGLGGNIHVLDSVYDVPSSTKHSVGPCMPPQIVSMPPTCPRTVDIGLSTMPSVVQENCLCPQAIISKHKSLHMHHEGPLVNSGKCSSENSIERVDKSSTLASTMASIDSRPSWLNECSGMCINCSNIQSGFSQGHSQTTHEPCEPKQTVEVPFVITQSPGMSTSTCSIHTAVKVTAPDQRLLSPPTQTSPSLGTISGCSTRRKSSSSSISSTDPESPCIFLKPSPSTAELGRLTSSETISNYCQVTGYKTEQDVERLNQALERLNMSGFYYGKLAMQDAKKKLRPCSVGTFLLRDSSDPKFLFSLSIKTSRGTTSIRILYQNSQFKLDSADDSTETTPTFDCVVKLIQYYVGLSADRDTNNCVFLESTGRKDTPVLLKRPYIESALGLKHLCRSVVNQHLKKDALGTWTTLPSGVRKIILEYPYVV